MPWLPERLPERAEFVWEKTLSNQGLAGVTVAGGRVFVVDRDAADATDIFRCLDAATGTERWALRYPAPGNLDYGNSPRAAPLAIGDRVFLLGAFGHLTCASVATGEPVWRCDLRTQFAVTEKLVWGFASSPLVVDGRLIVNPGGAAASLAALDPKSGTVIWQSPGDPAAFSSFIEARLGGRRQLVGYDKNSLGGWDFETGRRLWRLAPQYDGDFNVPTPIAVGEHLIVSSENNGTREYAFDAEGRIVAEPVGRHEDLAPDTHTPVVVGRRLFGVWQGRFFCLDIEAGLKEIYAAEDDALLDYATILASDDRLLVTTQSGELLLVDATADEFRIVSRLKLFDGESGVYSHPALVGDRLYVRSSDRIVCVRLSSGDSTE